MCLPEIGAATIAAPAGTTTAEIGLLILTLQLQHYELLF